MRNYKNIYIFGAHIFSQLRIFNGLNKKKISAILDNDFNKVENFLYGTSLKVYNPNFIKKIDQPCVILRAGSYNNEIKKQLLNINKKTVII